MKSIFIWIFFLLTIQLSTAQNNACNCCSESHNQFDFWIGNWEVTLPNGNIAGENSIVKEQGNCVLRESWKGANGNFTGTSLNYYNTGTGKWEQLWIDVSGTILKLSGNRKDNKMILRSEPKLQEDGSFLVQQISWTLLEDGNVRQLWELLRNDLAINVYFDGLYKKKE